jgi:hypothetical protein
VFIGKSPASFEFCYQGLLDKQSGKVFANYGSIFIENRDSFSVAKPNPWFGTFLCGLCGYYSVSFAAIPPWTQIFLAKSSLAHTFRALYAKGDCKTQNEESSGETL